MRSISQVRIILMLLVPLDLFCFLLKQLPDSDHSYDAASELDQLLNNVLCLAKELIFHYLLIRCHKVLNENLKEK